LSVGDAVKQMDTQNKWNAARKVMKEVESPRVSLSPIANLCAYSGTASANATQVTLWKQFCALT
jgi:hypothetical protein